MSDVAVVTKRLEAIAAEWAGERHERQLRRSLRPADFDKLRDAGYLALAVPTDLGGLWDTTRSSARGVCQGLRLLAHGDSSIALVSAMHPAVLQASADARDADDAWQAQRRWIFETVDHGAFWGTMVSEPGSGGDRAKTRTGARLLPGGGYLLGGLKHFGSGSGMTSFMVTTAIPEGEDKPVTFLLDVREVAWDGSTGMELKGEWDGHGMTATQSHAFELTDFPATRLLCPAESLAAAFHPCLFSAVILGIVETAIETATPAVVRRLATLRSYERVEWSNAQMEAWLIAQAYEGMLRALEEDENPRLAALQGKTAIAQLAESCLTRICRVLGGGTFGRQGPFGFWLEDVRALGFLRPPWGLAYDTLFEESAGLP